MQFEDTGCTCQVGGNPPCAFCVSMDDEESEVYWKEKSLVDLERFRAAREEFYSQRMPKLIHRSWSWGRTRYIPGVLERIFADNWEKDCQRQPGMNFGYGTLQDLMIDSKGVSVFSVRKLIAKITPRDAMIVATVVQWLGTNVGFCWISAVLRKAGYNVEKIERRDDTALVIIEFTDDKARIIRHFKDTMRMTEIGKLPALIGQNTHQFRRNFKYLCDVGVCCIEERPAGKFASLSPEGAALLDHSMPLAELKGENRIRLRIHAPLRWLETTKVPFEFVAVKSAPPPELRKPNRDERIAAIKHAQAERINARKFGELDASEKS